jgi:hypothetical protein
VRKEKTKWDELNRRVATVHNFVKYAHTEYSLSSPASKGSSIPQQAARLLPLHTSPRQRSGMY